VFHGVIQKIQVALIFETRCISGVVSQACSKDEKYLCIKHFAQVTRFAVGYLPRKAWTR